MPIQSSALKDITQRNIELVAQIEARSVTSRSFGERLADRVAAVVGSWFFIIMQSVLAGTWMILNLVGWWQQWDAYPFALLNLLLSCQVAVSTPIILMSQNRQSRLNERRNHLALQINLLAEQENTEQLRLLRLLCEKAGIEIEGAAQQALEQSIEPDDIVRQITETVEGEPASQS